VTVHWTATSWKSLLRSRRRKVVSMSSAGTWATAAESGMNQ